MTVAFSKNTACYLGLTSICLVPSTIHASSLITRVKSAKAFIGAMAILFLTTRPYAVNRLDTDLIATHFRCLRGREMTTDKHFMWQELTPSLPADKTLCVRRYFEFLPLPCPLPIQGGTEGKAENGPAGILAHNWDRVGKQWDFTSWGLKELGGV